MGRRVVALGVAAALLIGACKNKDTGVVKRDGEPDFVTSFDEKRVDAAIAEARATLGEFEKALGAREPGTDGFAVKKGFRWGSGGTEYIWVGDVQREGDAFVGVIDNEPVNPVGVKLNERVSVARGDVADWMYMAHGKLRGGYTIAALAYGTPEQDEYTKNMGIDWSAYKFLKGAK